MTTEHKHTPGPWKLQKLGSHTDYADWQPQAIRSPQNICLAVVGQVDRFESECIAANAELMARAPDLLAENERLRAESRIAHDTHVNAIAALKFDRDEADREMNWLAQQLANTRAHNAELLAALKQVTAGCAVIVNHAGATHPGLADADNLASVRGFAHENFCIGRAAINKADAS